MEQITFTGDNFKEFIEKCIELKTENIQTAVTNIDIRPLRDNSVYVIEFPENISPKSVAKYIDNLNERVKGHGIIFVASNPWARIKGGN